jgi:hypothetical protein
MGLIDIEIVNEFDYLEILFKRKGNFNKTVKRQVYKVMYKSNV